MTNTRNNESKTYTDESGKFAPGNPGRPKGARHRTTRAIEGMLQGEADGLTRKAIDLALRGDTTALRLCLERIAPPRKDGTVSFNLPAMECASDASSSAKAVLLAVSESEITPLEGAAVMNLIEAYRRVLELSEYEGRITALERAIEGNER